MAVQLISSIARPESLARQAYTAVRKAIRDGMIVPGTFYSEVQIAKLLAISRTPVREALIELSREGIVEKLPQRGFRLRAISEKERKEAFALRELLESYVVRRLAAEATNADIRNLRGMLDRQSRARQDPSAFLEIDEEFHLAMPRMLGLHRTRDLLLMLRGIIWLSGLAAISRTERLGRVLREHRAVLDGIAARDPAGAVNAIQKHIANTAEAAAGSTVTRAWVQAPATSSRS